MQLKLGKDIVKVRKKIPFDFADAGVSRFVRKGAGCVEIDPVFFNQQVPNIRRYKLELQKGHWSFIRYQPLNPISSSSFPDDENFAHLSNASDNVVFMILESPHEKEFDDEFNHIAPAQGSTGIKIKDHIKDVLSDIIKLHSSVDGIYDFCLINPVRSQTSLFYLHKQPLNENRGLRNEIWKYLWKDLSRQQDLLNVLNDSRYTNKIVINACTSPIKYILSDFLHEHSIDFVSVNHPSGWFYIVNRAVKKGSFMICPKCKNRIPTTLCKCSCCGLRLTKKKS